jgi:anti-sigma-K factor RskA
MSEPDLNAPDDLDLVAGEYVLGTLPSTERATLAARRHREPAVDQAIKAWELRFGPLHESVPEQTPPPDLKQRVLDRIGELLVPASAKSAQVIALKRSLSRWRGIAIGTSAMAAALTGVTIYQTLIPTLQKTNAFVAVLQKDAASPAFLMTVDVLKRTFNVRQVAAPRQAGKSYELWLIAENLGAPRSLGLVGELTGPTRPQLANYAPTDIQAATYAVTLEAEGGSSSGAPTGPVLYAGKLIQTLP